MLKAILFDLDGTIVETDRLHEKAWVEALARHDIVADHTFYQTMISGGTNPEILRRIFPTISEDEIERFADKKEQDFRDQAQNVEVVDGFWEIWNWAEMVGLKRVLVSNAPRANVDFMLGKFRLAFDLVVLGEDMTEAKPSPVPYQFALEQVKISPLEAVAFEDSPSGVRSAVAAGVPTVGLTTGHSEEALWLAGCIEVFANFDALDLKLFLQGVFDQLDSSSTS